MLAQSSLTATPTIYYILFPVLKGRAKLNRAANAAEKLNQSHFFD